MPKGKGRMKTRVIYTIGTSTRLLREFIEILKERDVKRLVDVRRFPTSSRFPHFKKERLSRSLPRSGIEYVYLGDKLGGYRAEGYDAYTVTEEFFEGIKELERFAAEKKTAVACAERFFWRCHRRFIADELIKRGWDVRHIMEKGKLMKGRVRSGT
jgi:uncharacterized protein (DUF488 family)